MRKTLCFLFLALLFTCVSCNNTKKLVIDYYDSNKLITTQEYENDLLPYEKNNYEFLGWYLEEDFKTLVTKDNISSYKDKIALYAKMRRIMKDFTIYNPGKLNDTETVLNPAFTWDNINEDTNFQVIINKGNTEVVNTLTENTYYQVSALLDQDTDYSITITGTTSNHSTTYDFKTLKSFSSINTPITTYSPYSNNMVLQRDEVSIITGKAPAKELITASFNGKNYYGLSDSSGKYEIVVAEQEATFEPFNITITNGLANSRVIKNVLIGDVYLFAGQSNMQWQTKNSDYLPEDITNAINSNVRFFSQGVTESTTKLETVKGEWFAASQSGLSNYSAIATMAGSILSDSLKNEVPIGILTAYQGNTNIANWMSSDYYQGTCSTKYFHYNGMIYPIRNANLKGVVWYQGCNNSARGNEYKDLLLSLFANYRDLFRNPNLPFFVIGLACYDGDSGNNYDFSYVRESQAMACQEDSNAYFITSCDDGDPTYIHPSTKRYICERISKSIQAVIYGKDYYSEGPTYKSHTVSGNVVTIEFNNELGLYATGSIDTLYLAGSDGKYYKANNALISNNKLIASSDSVSNPVYIKYGFGKSPFVNIFNKDGFAIVPFRTDSYNTNIDLFDYEDTSKYDFHPDGSTMQVSANNGELTVTKTNDGKTYGSIRLYKWGAIAYEPQGFRFTLTGSNSGASVAIRFIEGESYEIWGYKIVDDFTGDKTFEISTGELQVLYGKQDNVFNTQNTSYIELMIEGAGKITIKLKEARFINMERSKPRAFNIATVLESDGNVSISMSKSIFADSYKLLVSKDGENYTNPVIDEAITDLTYTTSKSIFEVGKPYYVKCIAINELGETIATNSGFVFYPKDDSKLIICNFDFKDQAALDAYISSSMDVNAGLTTTLEDEGIKITTSKGNWMQFIFKLETGSAKDMTKLQFYADFTNYTGTVTLQLADTNWNVYDYQLDLSTTKEGTFVIDFSDFIKNKTTPFTNQTLMWVMFNFVDNNGNGIILFDDCILTK